MAAAIGKQGHTGRGGGHTGDATQQPAGGHHRIARRQALQGSFANHQLLPPAAWIPGNHWSHQLFARLAAQLQQLAKTLVVSGELTQPGLILQPLGLLDPFALGCARPKGATQNGIGIGHPGALTEPNGNTSHDQQRHGPNLQDQPDGREAQPGASLHDNQVEWRAKSGVSSTRCRRL